MLHIAFNEKLRRVTLSPFQKIWRTVSVSKYTVSKYTLFYFGQDRAALNVVLAQFANNRQQQQNGGVQVQKFGSLAVSDVRRLKAFLD